VVTVRKLTLAAAAPLLLGLLAACGSSSQSSGSNDSPIYFGVSAPVSGNYAEYGKFYRQGFDLALDEINGSGGVAGRKVELVWEDSQSDPKQSVPIAQKFASDQRIIAELGDFSSPASMAASPIYERNKLVQYGFTNSSPKFTQGGKYMFSPGISQAQAEVQQADALAKFGKSVAIIYQNTDWGKTVFDIFSQRAKELGVTVTYSESYLPSLTDYRPLLIKARDTSPEIVYDIGYDNDAALFAQQVKAVGITAKVFVQQFTDVGIKLAGKDAEGVITTATWFPEAPIERIQKFVDAYKKKYNEVPGAFQVYAYDALKQLAYAAQESGASRDGIFKGLNSLTDLPSVQQGPFKYESDRRPKPVPAQVVVVKNGALVLAPGN
jgi:branched-chain amino acid transport system substrate-binding protein